MGIESVKNFFNNLSGEESVEKKETPKMLNGIKNIDKLFDEFDQRV